jgi:fatty-acyl-CoA synthase
VTTFTGPPVESETYIGPLTFGGFLDELAERHGEREAVVLSVPGRPRVAWSFDGLRNEARSVARALIAAGVSRGTRVGVLTSGRPEWVSAVWGAVIAGGVAVPFNTFAEPRELDHLLRHSDVAIVVTEIEFLGHRYVDQIVELCNASEWTGAGRLLSASFPFLQRIVALDAGDVPEGGAVQTWDDFLAAGAAVPDAVLDGVIRETTPADDGIIIYSSGSTSLPKGVLHMHRSPMMQSWRHSHREQFTPGDRVYSEVPLFWTAGFAASLGSTLASGACYFMQPRFDASDALRLIEEERITILQCMPHHDIDLQESLRRTPRDISSIRRDRYRLTGEPAPGKKTANQSAYGSSETFTSLTALPYDAPPEDLVTYGRLTGGSSVRIMDAMTGESLGVGEQGEIILKGPTLMRSYVKRAPEEAFDADGYFHTGDAGWIDDSGRLHWTGRLTNMIKTSGANVSPVEVEEQLMTHPCIKEVAVVGVPDDVAGELVVACAVLIEGTTLTEEEARHFLRGSLASYKIPRRVFFFGDGDLPRTGSDKFNLPAVRALAAELLADDGPAATGRTG